MRFRAAAMMIAYAYNALSAPAGIMRRLLLSFDDLALCRQDII